MTREVIKKTTETRGRGALMRWKHFLSYNKPLWQQWWFRSSHTYTLCAVCVCVTFSCFGDQSPGNNSVPHSPLFRVSSSLSYRHTHTYTHRVSEVRVKGRPLFIQAWLWGSVTHINCLSLWASIMTQMTAWNKVWSWWQLRKCSFGSEVENKRLHITSIIIYRPHSWSLMQVYYENLNSFYRFSILIHNFADNMLIPLECFTERNGIMNHL